ncbi:MAG: NAD(P)H-dependent oxidoreductase subunit E, partial [Caldimonas sp.]
MDPRPESLASPPVVASVSAEEMRKRIKKRSRLKGRQTDDVSLAQVRDLLGPCPAAGWRRDRLIEHLHLLNDHYGGLHERHLVALARETNVPMAEVYEVATFYHHFEVLADGENAAVLTVRICDGLSCELAGARRLLDELPGLLGPDARVLAAPCVGRCEQAPVAIVGQRPVPRAEPSDVLAAVRAGETRHASARAGSTFAPASLAEKSVSERDADVSPGYVDHSSYRAAGGYSLAAEIAAGKRSPDELVKILEDSGLRGLGGAGFPAGRRWRIVGEQPAPRLMAVNIDEGEPGTFKDRTYLERDPHRFLEGMLIAATVVGVEACYIYLRDEYHGCRELLAAQLLELQRNPPYPLPHIELRRGAGAYICGEESAMIESIEGKRGEPRLRPPYIAQTGLFGRPTLEHNFETLYWVRDIVERGPAWFAGFGRNGRKGLRSFSVSGRVKRPGVKLAPAGITLNELVDEYCGGMADGHALYAYLPGGASGGILPARLADIPLDFDTLQPHDCFIGSAAVIVLSDRDRARDAASNMMRFFADESCGQCTPCRVGT